MQILLSVLFGILIIVGSFLVVSLNLLYKDIIKEIYNYLERNDKNGNIK